MPNYRVVGTVPHKRHTQLRGPEGALRFEELFSLGGFAEESSLLYHVGEPTDVATIVARPDRVVRRWEGQPIRHHRLSTAALASKGDYVESRVPLFFHDDLTVSFAAPDSDSTVFYRNGLRDELVTVIAGSGTLRTQFGALRFGADDLVVIPRGSIQHWSFDAGDQRLIVVESTTTIRPPGRYLTPRGQFTEHSPVCERDLRAPELEEPRDEPGEFVVRVRVGERESDHHHATHPFDVVGWDGCAYPYALNLADYEPLTRRIHTMPDDGQVFEAADAAVCVLVPRLGDYHPDSVSSPPYHSNVDCDEVTVYLDGNGDGDGEYIAFHPRGIAHGPKPGLYEASIGRREVTMKVFMVDSFRPLHLADAVAAADESGYPLLWHEPERR